MRTSFPRLIVTLSCAALLASCGLSGPTETAKDSLVLAGNQEVGGYNPINGYGQLGVSLVYDGLLRPDAPDDRQVPTLVPALAAKAPTVSNDGLLWTVELREGVKFHDGSALDAADVVATYRAIADKASASEIAEGYNMIESVTATSERTVAFRLKYPYADFASCLLVGIAPSELITTGPARDSALNQKPVGTGPYRLDQLLAGEARFVANADYWAGKPQVGTVIQLHVGDDNVRAQRFGAGDFDGAILPPLLAKSFQGKDGIQQLSARTADWRAITLPARNPVTKDPAMRRALNLAVQRDQLVQVVLGGSGRPADTPWPQELSSQTTAPTLGYDLAQAAKILDDAGWKLGADGVRVKGSQRAEFTIMYSASDTVRRDLVVGIAGDFKKLGVIATPQGLSWEQIEPRAATDPLLLAGGSNPYSLDAQLYPVLHSRTAETGVYDNPGEYTNPAIDRLLAEARRTPDEQRRRKLYDDALTAYRADPGYVFVAFVDHAYVSRASGWKPTAPILEPHEHGVAWGPWWGLARWRR